MEDYYLIVYRILYTYLGNYLCDSCELTTQRLRNEMKKNHKLPYEFFSTVVKCSVSCLVCDNNKFFHGKFKKNGNKKKLFVINQCKLKP